MIWNEIEEGICSDVNTLFIAIVVSVGLCGSEVRSNRIVHEIRLDVTLTCYVPTNILKIA